MAKAATIQSSNFIFEWESRICTSMMAINAGASNVTKFVIASRLLEAIEPETTAAIQNKSRPISRPVKRYRNLLPQKLHTNQITNENIRTADMDKV